MIVSFFDSVTANQPEARDLTFGELCGFLRLGSGSPWCRSNKADALCFVPASFEGRRSRANLRLRYAFTGDVDGGRGANLSFAEIVGLLRGLGFAFCAYSTTNSTKTANRYRVVIPFDAPVDADTYVRASWSIDAMLGEIFDVKTFDAPRLSIVPFAWYGSPADCDWDESEAHHGYADDPEGIALDPVAIIEAFPVASVMVAKPDLDVAAILASLPPPRETRSVPWDVMEDPDRSPIVAPAFVSDFLSAPEGGRFYTFMVRVASRALRLGYESDPRTVLALALRVNGMAGGKRRPNALHEANRAVAFAAARHNEQPTTTFSPGEAYELLRKKRKYDRNRT